MVLIPFRPDISLSASKMVAYMGVGGESFVMGASGISQPDQKQQLVIVYEKPISALNYAERSKDTKEDSHLHKFLLDYMNGTGITFCDTYRRGNDPPDYLILRRGKECLLDLAQFTCDKRRKALALFERIKTKVFHDEHGQYPNLFGANIVLNFDKDSHRQSSFPPTTNEEKYVDEIIRGLKSFVIDRSSWVESEADLPQKLEKENQKESITVDFYASPIQNIPVSEFFLKHNFELSLAFYSRYSLDDVIEEISRVVGKHDKPEIEEMIISFSAPNEKGIVYPSESIIMGLLSDSDTNFDLGKWKYIKVVHIHDWISGRIMTIYPRLSCPVNPRYFHSIMSSIFSYVCQS